MDELKLRLSSKFMRGIVTKIISKAIFKKFGYHVDIQLNKIEAETIDGKTCLHVDLDAEIDNAELTNILQDIGLMK